MQYRIERDGDPVNPREDFDHAGKMVCFHRRYRLGDKNEFSSPEDFEIWWQENGKGGIRLPLYLYDHSGITMNTSGFSCPWDSGQVGYIYATRQTILKEWCKGNRVSARGKALATKCLESEVVEYDSYLTGDVWGYVVEDDDGNTLDSCSGFYGHDYCETEAKSALAYCVKNANAEACMV